VQGPLTPGAGIKGVATKSLAGERLHPTETGPETQRRHKLTLRLDREADEPLFGCRLLNHEGLNRPTSELREMSA